MKLSQMTYEEAYNKYYLKLPKIISTILGVLAILLGVIDILANTKMFASSYDGFLSSIAGTQAYASAILALIIWAIVVFILFYVVNFLMRISISQKIMVVERLTQIRDNTQK